MCKGQAQGWESTYQRALEQLGFKRGRSSPCMFLNKACGIRLVVRGDDFFSVGLPRDVEWFENAILKIFEGKVNGRLTRPGEELRIRIMRRSREAYEW